ncbi:hypothetical protein DL769_004428 [Monosporascus sp. CRB-8-3]|nr:hypothetical protein DL769_004428 [Monosporascus sp. CRB-8-3]
MIALIATDRHEFQQNNLGLNGVAYEADTAHSTIIIVPPPLLDVWEEQLEQHVVKLKMKWIRHHNKSRLSNATKLNDFDIVLTTYHTVSADWKNGIAHVVRNSSSRMAKAVCSIKATCRWAVTGTPIQNRMADLAALLKFLQIEPYDNVRRFDADITRLWKSGEAQEAINRLKRLTGWILLRRPKKTIDLPTRRDLRWPVEFSTDERALYDELKGQTIASVRDVSDSTYLPNSTTFVNVIQQINSLRMICSMGLHYEDPSPVTFAPPPWAQVKPC